MNQQNKPIQPYKCLDVGMRRHNAQSAANADNAPASLFDPNFERAACGVGFIVNINGVASRKVSCATL